MSSLAKTAAKQFIHKFFSKGRCTVFPKSGYDSQYQHIHFGPDCSFSGAGVGVSIGGSSAPAAAAAPAAKAAAAPKSPPPAAPKAAAPAPAVSLQTTQSACIHQVCLLHSLMH